MAIIVLKPGFFQGLFTFVIMSLASPLYSDSMSTTNQTILFTLAAQDDAEQIQKLLGSNVDIDYKDNKGRTALLIATHNNSINAARVLIKAGADVNAMDNISDSPYLYAGAEGRLDILRMTLNHGADLASVNRYGGTALIPAAHHAHIETVRKLLTTTVDINHVNDPGWTALMEAIVLGDGSETYYQIILLLVDAGADVNIPDSNDISALTHAVNRGYTKIAELLLAAGAK